MTTLQSILESGRAKLRQQEAEREAREQKERDEMDAEREKFWQALLTAIKADLPDCLVPYSNATQRPNLADDEDFGRSGDEFQLTIEVPGCATVVRTYGLYDGGWYAKTDRYNDAKAWRVPTYHTGWYGDGLAYVQTARPDEWLAFSDLETALAMAERVQTDRAKLAAECEARNAETKARRAQRLHQPREKTVEERLLDVLREYVDSRMPEPVE